MSQSRGPASQQPARGVVPGGGPKGEHSGDSPRPDTGRRQNQSRGPACQQPTSGAVPGGGPKGAGIGDSHQPDTKRRQSPEPSGAAAVRITVADVRQRTCKIYLPRSGSYNRLQVAEGMQDVGVDLARVEALGTKQQNNIWFVTFLDQALQEDFLSLGVLKVTGKNGFISSLNAESHRVRIHWAPYHLSNATLRQKLESCLPDGAKLISLGYEHSQIKGMEHIATLVRYAVVHFSGPSSLLPHIISVTQDKEVFELLLTIQGRDPICLKCRQVGHVRNQCYTPFCTLCKKSGHHSTSCGDRKPSYATAVSTEGAIQEPDEPEEEDERGRVDPREREEGGDRVPPESFSLGEACSSALQNTSHFPPLSPANSVDCALNMVRPSEMQYSEPQEETSSSLESSPRPQEEPSMEQDPPSQLLGASLPCGQVDPPDMEDDAGRQSSSFSSGESSGESKWAVQVSKRKRRKKMSITNSKELKKCSVSDSNSDL